MKKLFLTALILLSPMTFAKDFNPDLLVGKWQCKAVFNYPNIAYQGVENNVSTFYKDGKSHSIGRIDAFENGEKTIVTFEDVGIWKMKEDIFSVNTQKLLNYKASNETDEESNLFKAFVEQDDTFDDSKILTLTKNKLVLTLTKEEQIKDNAELIETCNRIK